MPQATMACRGFLLLLFVGPMFLVVLSVYQWDMSLEEREGVHRQQEVRKQLLRRQCDGDGFAEGKRSLEDMSDRELENLIVDDNYDIIYYYIPTVACTNWKRVFLVLNQSKPHPDPMSICPENVHIDSKFTFLNRFPKLEIKASREGLAGPDSPPLTLSGTRLSVSSPPTETSSRSKMHTSISTLASTFCTCTATSLIRNSARGTAHEEQRTRSSARGTAHEAFASSMHVSFYNNFIQYLLDP